MHINQEFFSNFFIIKNIVKFSRDSCSSSRRLVDEDNLKKKRNIFENMN